MLLHTPPGVIVWGVSLGCADEAGLHLASPVVEKVARSSWLDQGVIRLILATVKAANIY